ncbi:MAG: type IV pilus assembly protein PilM [bacterium]
MAFSFSSIFSSNKEVKAVGIDIGSSSIKIVEIKKKGPKAVLTTYGSIALGPYAKTDVGRVTNLPIEQIVAALKEVMKQSGTTTSQSALSIPVQSSLIFTVELPVEIKEADIAAVIPTEARKHIPVAISEVSLDYFLLPKKEKSFEEANDPDMPAGPRDKKTEVLVVAIQNNAIAMYRSLVSQCALAVSFFEIEIFSSLRANFEHELALVLLMDFGASRTKLTLVEFGMVKSYHTVNRGGADISDAISKSLSVPFARAEELKKEYGLTGAPPDAEIAETIKTHVNYIFSETNNVLLGHEKKYNQTISKVILTGGGALMKGLKEMAAANFRADVEVGHPFSKVGAPGFLEKVFEATGPEFAVALGVALRKLQ